MSTLEQNSAKPEIIGNVTDKERVLKIDYKIKQMFLT
jgi:hypothetical protein